MERVMINGLRIWFLVLYAIGIITLLIKFVPTRDRAKSAEKRIEDSRRLLPMIFLPIDWFVPPLLMLSGIGQLSAVWPPIRILGFALSFYALIILIWVPRVLGRFLVPQAAVFSDHVLVTAGPFKFIRHPSFSGALALWLGTALGTLNWLLLGLWFLLPVGKTFQARTEEELLRAKFGSTYDAYARQTGRFIPKLWGHKQCE